MGSGPFTLRPPAQWVGRPLNMKGRSDACRAYVTVILRVHTTLERPSKNYSNHGTGRALREH